MLTDRWDMTDDLMFEPSHSGSLFAFENADTGWEQDMILEENIIAIPRSNRPHSKIEKGIGSDLGSDRLGCFGL